MLVNVAGTMDTHAEHSVMRYRILVREEKGDLRVAPSALLSTVLIIRGARTRVMLLVYTEPYVRTNVRAK